MAQPFDFGKLYASTPNKNGDSYFYNNWNTAVPLNGVTLNDVAKWGTLPKTTLDDLQIKWEELTAEAIHYAPKPAFVVDSISETKPPSIAAACCSKCKEEAGMANVSITDKGVMLYMVCSNCEYEWFYVVKDGYRAESSGGDNPKPLIPGAKKVSIKKVEMKKIEKVVEEPAAQASPNKRLGQRKIDMS